MREEIHSKSIVDEYTPVKEPNPIRPFSENKEYQSSKEPDDQTKISTISSPRLKAII